MGCVQSSEPTPVARTYQARSSSRAPDTPTNTTTTSFKVHQGEPAGLRRVRCQGTSSVPCARHYGACATGYARDQDRFSVVSLSDTLFIGVFDGHGDPTGGESATAASLHVAKETCSRILASSAATTPGNTTTSDSAPHAVGEAVTSAFLAHQALCTQVYTENTLKPVLELKKKLEEEAGVDDLGMSYPHEGGTTATVAIVKADHLWLAWVGDSRGVVGTLNTSTMRPMCSFATEDHDVDNEAEVERATNAGGATFGRYFAANGVDGMLQLSRSLGDVAFHRDDIVLATPQLWDRPLTPDDMFVVMASDGVWGCFESDEVVSFVYDQLCARGYGVPGEAMDDATATLSAAGGGAQGEAKVHEEPALVGDVEAAVQAAAVALEEEAHSRCKTGRLKLDDISVTIVTFAAFWSKPRERAAAAATSDAATAPPAVAAHAVPGATVAAGPDSPHTDGALDTPLTKSSGAQPANSWETHDA